MVKLHKHIGNDPTDTFRHIRNEEVAGLAFISLAIDTNVIGEGCCNLCCRGEIREKIFETDTFYMYGIAGPWYGFVSVPACQPVWCRFQLTLCLLQQRDTSPTIYCDIFLFFSALEISCWTFSTTWFYNINRWCLSGKTLKANMLMTDSQQWFINLLHCIITWTAFSEDFSRFIFSRLSAQNVQNLKCRVGQRLNALFIAGQKG